MQTIRRLVVGIFAGAIGGALASVGLALLVYEWKVFRMDTTWRGLADEQPAPTDPSIVVVCMFVSIVVLLWIGRTTRRQMLAATVIGLLGIAALLGSSMFFASIASDPIKQSFMAQQNFILSRATELGDAGFRAYFLFTLFYTVICGVVFSIAWRREYVNHRPIAKTSDQGSFPPSASGRLSKWTILAIVLAMIAAFVTWNRLGTNSQTAIPTSSSPTPARLSVSASVAPTQPVAIAQSTQTSSSPPAPKSAADSPADAKKELDQYGLLHIWVDSFKQKDLVRHVNCYAPEVETYFKWHNVARQTLSSDKGKLFDSISEVRTMEVSDLNLQKLSAQESLLTFNKKWDIGFTSGKSYAGEEVEQLGLQLVDGTWQIKSEQELKILWTKRQ